MQDDLQLLGHVLVRPHTARDRATLVTTAAGITAGADTHVNLPLLEDALARMVNAFQDLAILVPMSTDLKDIEQEGNPPQVLADGTVEIRMKLGWGGVNAISRVMREQAKKAAVAFVEKAS